MDEIGFIAPRPAVLSRRGEIVADLVDLLPQGCLVHEPRELVPSCCVSAGTYNILQPEMACKVKNIEATKPDLIATGNIGCITQIATGTEIPILHTVELLNWAMADRSRLPPDRLSKVRD